MDGQLSQDELIDQGENGCIRADPERQRQDGDDREHGASKQAANGQAEIGRSGAHWGIGRARQADGLLARASGHRIWPRTAFPITQEIVRVFPTMSSVTSAAGVHAG